MKVEISHDSLAKKIFSMIDLEDQIELRVTQRIISRYEEYLNSLQDPGSGKPALLSKRDLDLIEPHLEHVEVTKAQADFISKSKKTIKGKELRSVLFLIWVIAILAISGALTMYMYIRSERQSDAFNHISTAFDANNYDRTLAFNLVEAGLALDKNNELALAFRNDILIGSLQFPFYYDMISDSLDQISDMVVSGDNKYLVAGSLEGNIYVYPLIDGIKHDSITLRKEVKGAINDVDMVGNYGFITGGQNGDVYYWNKKGEKWATFPHGEAVYAVKMYKEQEDTLIYSVGRKEIHIWDLKDKNISPPDSIPRKTLPISNTTNLEIIKDPISKKEFLVTGGRDSTIRITDLSSKELIGSVTLEGAIENMDYFRDENNEQLMLGLESGVLIILDLSRGVEPGIQTKDPLRFEAHREAIKDVIFSDDGTQILTSSRDKQAKLWFWKDKSSPPILQHTFIGHEEGVRSVAFAQRGDTKIIYTGGEDKTIKIWPLLKKESGKLPDLKPNEYTSMAVTANKEVILGDQSGQLVRYSIQPLTESFYKEKINRKSGSKITRILPLKSSDFILVSDNQIEVWVDFKLDTTFSYPGEKIKDVTVSPDSSFILCNYTNNSLRLIKLRTNKERVIKASQTGVNKIAISPDGQWVLSATEGNLIQLSYIDQEMNTLKSLAPLYSLHADDVLSVGFSPDGQFCYSTSKDNSIVLYLFKNAADYKNPDPFRDTIFLRRHNADVNALTFSPPTSTNTWTAPVAFNEEQTKPKPIYEKMLSVSADGTVRIWRTDGKEEPSLISSEYPIVDGAFIDEHVIITRDDQRTIQIWDLSSIEAIKTQIFRHDPKNMRAMLDN